LEATYGAAGIGAGVDGDGDANGGGIHAQATNYPQLGFDTKPAYMSNKEVVLTFDDVPGWQPTTMLSILDTLKQFNVKATFFFNSMQNSATDWTYPDCVKAVQRVLAEGHRIGSHTRSHPHLGDLTGNLAQLRDEINGVQAEIQSFMPAGTTIPRLTLFRAPYGEPYQWRWQGDPQGDASYPIIAPIVAQNFVHIGWNLDSQDWTCPTTDTGACMYNSVVSQLKAGGYGVILMHGVDKTTMGGLPNLLTYLKNNGYSVIDVETVVARLYGANSLGVVTGNGGGGGGAATTKKATTAAKKTTTPAHKTTTHHKTTTPAHKTTTHPKTTTPAHARTTTHNAVTKLSATTAAANGGGGAGSGTCLNGSPECNCDIAVSGVSGPQDGAGCLTDALCLPEFNCSVVIHNKTFCCAQNSARCNITVDANDLVTCDCGITGTALPGETDVLPRHAHRLWRLNKLTRIEDVK
jgi:peptidoglycan/xylan/chitin deacetylase (PgdA/CDA1 family)